MTAARSARRGRRATRLAASVAAVVALIGASAPAAAGHAVLERADPAGAVRLGAAPTRVTLEFSERPAASLSTLRVLGSDGANFARSRPATVGATGFTVALSALPRGVYTVRYRVVSAVDGHATTGALAFGVDADPTAISTTTSADATSVSALEIAARWLFLGGLAALLGAVAAALRSFGPPGLRLAVGGWLVAAVGVLLLAEAQRRTVQSSLSGLLDTQVGHALIWRAVAVAIAGAALATASRRGRAAPVALALAAASALAAIAVHAAAGHAGAGSWPRGATIAAQVVHVAAIGIWLGGLAALLTGPGARDAGALRRFSALAGVALVTVVLTGTLRAIDELTGIDELLTTGYGRAVLAKILAIAALVVLGRRQRRLGVPAAGAGEPRPLLTIGRAELTVGLGALAAAATLGALAPPATSAPDQRPQLHADGTDAGTTTRVRLTTASDQPGSNRFSVRVSNYDSGDPVPARSVSLRFRAPGDPGIAATTLRLRRDGRARGSFAGTGANLAFDGRWIVTAVIERGTDTAEVPLSLDVPSPPHALSIQRIPGRPPLYTAQIIGSGSLRISPEHEHPGPVTLTIAAFTIFEEPAEVDTLVLTAGGRQRQVAVDRSGPGTFTASLRFTPGPFTITPVARTADGARLRYPFTLRISARP